MCYLRREVRIWFTSHLNVQLPSADVISRGQNWGTGISLTGLRMGGDRRGVNSFLVIGNPPSSFLVFRLVPTYKLGPEIAGLLPPRRDIIGRAPFVDVECAGLADGRACGIYTAVLSLVYLDLTITSYCNKLE